MKCFTEPSCSKNRYVNELVSGQNINLVSGQNINLVSGQNINLVSGQNINLVSGQNINLVSGQNINCSSKYKFTGIFAEKKFECFKCKS